MARNPNIAKMRRQRSRRKLGPFRTWTDPSTIDPDYLKQQTKLKRFWAERVSTPHGIDRSNIPDKERGYVNYRGHAKTLGVDSRYVTANPKEQAFLRHMFPGVRFSSVERDKVLQKISEMILEGDPTSCIVVERSRFRVTYLYYNPTKTLWWFVEQDKFVLRNSITYGTQDRARAVHKMGCVRWKPPVPLQPDSS